MKKNSIGLLSSWSFIIFIVYNFKTSEQIKLSAKHLLENSDFSNFVGNEFQSQRYLQEILYDDDDDEVENVDIRRRKREASQSRRSSLANVCAASPSYSGSISKNAVPTDVWASSDFCELLIYGRHYVDKSPLIADILNGDDTVPTIKRPSGWGKTVNLNMIQRFLEHELDERGNPLPVTNDSLNYKLFAGGEIRLPSVDSSDAERIVCRLKPLKVMELVNVTEYLGRWPVISFTFKHITGFTYREIEHKTRKLISELYRKHRHLADWLTNRDDNGQEAEEKKAKFDRFLNGTSTYLELEQSVYFLSRLLYERYDKKVYILIDDHDTPVYQFYLHLNDTVGSDVSVQDSREYVEFLNLFGNIVITALRRTHYLAQAMVTGFAASNLFDYNVLDEQISQYFGFLPEEIDRLLLNNNNNNNNSNSYDKRTMKKWYYGYSFGVSEEHFYVPYSIVRYLFYGRFEYYTLNDRNTATLDRYVMQDWFQPTMRLLLAGTTLNEPIEGIHSFPNMHVRRRFVVLLLFYGFLNPVWFKYYKAELNLCNEEMKRYYEIRLEKWFAVKLTNQSECVDDLLTGRIDGFGSKLNTTVRRYTSEEFPKTGPDIVRLYKVVLKSFLKSSSAITNDIPINSDADNSKSDNSNVKFNSSSKVAVLLVEPRVDKYDTAVVLTVIAMDDDKRADDNVVSSKLKEAANYFRNDLRTRYRNLLNNNRRVKKILNVCLTFDHLDVYAVHCGTEANVMP